MLNFNRLASILRVLRWFWPFRRRYRQPMHHPRPRLSGQDIRRWRP